MYAGQAALLELWCGCFRTTMDGAGWSLTESNPSVFTSLLHELGVSGLTVDEVLALDSDYLDDLQPIKAFVFLFRWEGHTDTAASQGASYETPAQPHYFAHQVIQNACASIALLNAVLNIPDLARDRLGATLSELKEFSAPLDPETRGWTLAGSDKLREAHNSLARADPYQLDEYAPADKDDEVFHFITYVPIGDTLYELDGLKKEPVSHGKAPGTSWTSHALDVIQKRISLYPATELKFNCLAVSSRMAHAEARLRELDAALQESNAAGMVADRHLAGGISMAALRNERAEISTRIAQLRAQQEDYAFEAAVSRHNYVGLTHALLKALAKDGCLSQKVAEARAKHSSSQRTVDVE